MNPRERIEAAKSLLFVPADRPDRFDKALAAGADLVILDLEDAVAAAAKPAARAALSAWLDADKPVVVRINSGREAETCADWSACDHPGVIGVMVPKATREGLVCDYGKPIIALIECARGVAELPTITAMDQVVRLAIGAIDLAGDLGLGPQDELLDPIRLQMTIASRLAGKAAPIDGVTTNFRNGARLEADVARARALGFGGKLCIHPSQVEVVRTGFAPTADEVRWAQRIVENDSGGAVSLDGEMVDKPVVDRARRILAAH